jgi:taurine dioxygenase
MHITPTGAGLGATIDGLDLAAPMADSEVDAITRALGQYGVIRFPRQQLSGGNLRDFSARFGELEVHVSNVYQEPGIPEVMILSNVVENGKPIGLADAGQDWHTDMSYARMIAFANVLYAVKVPRRDGVVLGNTEFSNMHAAYEDLPADVKARIDGFTATHDFDKFWSMMVKRPGSKRAPLSEAQRKARPPVTHPVVLTHPITGRKVLYANPGYTVKINELPPAESDELLEYLFAHQLQPKYRYVHRWQEGDVLMWENFGTIHNAIADYRADEHRLVKRCQVMATRFFDENGEWRIANGE